MATVKSGKKSTKHLKVKKGGGEFLSCKFNRQENPMLDRIMKAENRVVLRREFGITLADDTDWPTTRRAQEMLLERGFGVVEDHGAWRVYRKP